MYLIYLSLASKDLKINNFFALYKELLKVGEILNIVQFNEKFKQYMNDVRIIEKTHPRESIGLWLQICQFIVQFAKSPNCPITLRKKLIVQAEIIIQKVRSFSDGEISSVFGSSITHKQSKTAENTQTSNIPFAVGEPPSGAESSSDDDMLNQLMSLPETPVDSTEVTTTTQPPDSSEATAPVESPVEPSTQDAETSNQEDLSKLQKLEETLKQMPKSFKEIKPLPFSSTSIVPELRPDSSQSNLDEFKKDTQTLDITTSVPEVSEVPPDLNQSSNPFEKGKNISIAGYKSDPFKSSDQQDSNVKDPFGPKAVSDSDDLKLSKKICFACGASLEEGDLICSQCGADNKES